VDGDGDLDMLVGSAGVRRSPTDGFRASVALFENVGSPARPRFNLVNENYLDFQAFNVRFLRLSVADLNQDRAPDLVLSYAPSQPLNARGQLAYLPNTAPSGQPVRFSLTNLQTLSVEGFGTNDEALFIDADADRDLDLLVGKTTGALQYHENTGSLTFVLRNAQAGGIAGDLLQLGLSLAASDLTGDGQPDLITGDRGGNLWIYPGFLANLNGNWVPQRNFVFNPLTNATGAYAFGYLSGGVLPAAMGQDLVLGTTGGGLRYLRPRSVVTGLPDEQALAAGFAIFPNPATGQVTLRATRPAHVEVCTPLGARVWEGEVDGAMRLPVGHWVPGLYLVRFQYPGGSVVRKLVVHP
jgi:hypothetical protein